MTRQPSVEASRAEDPQGTSAQTPVTHGGMPTATAPGFWRYRAWLPEFLRTIAHLRPRSNLFGAVFRLQRTKDSIDKSHVLPAVAAVQVQSRESTFLAAGSRDGIGNSHYASALSDKFKALRLVLIGRFVEQVSWRYRITIYMQR